MFSDWLKVYCLAFNYSYQHAPLRVCSAIWSQQPPGRLSLSGSVNLESAVQLCGNNNKWQWCLWMCLLSGSASTWNCFLFAEKFYICLIFNWFIAAVVELFHEMQYVVRVWCSWCASVAMSMVGSQASEESKQSELQCEHFWLHYCGHLIHSYVVVL